ncbi:MAG: DUF6538 domain-containing protein [Pseudomonadota bacterium]
MLAPGHKAGHKAARNAHPRAPCRSPLHTPIKTAHRHAWPGAPSHRRRRVAGAHLSWKAGRALYRRRVPRRFAALDPRGVIKFALGTSDPALAAVKAAAIDAELEAYWSALEAGAAGDAAARRAAIAALAEARGFPYRPIAELAEGPLTAILERLAERGEIRADAGARPALEAELSLAPAPPEGLEQALDRFYALTPEIAAGKSADQLRRARLPKAKAVRNLRQVVGPKPFHEIDDADALAFRGWWAERLAREQLTASAANKDISHLSAIWSTIERLERRGIRNPFQGLKFAERDNLRLPIAGAFVARHWLSAEGRTLLPKLNAEAAAILLGLVNTGLRPSELIGVAPGDLVFNGPLPHVVVRPSPSRDVKTPARRAARWLQPRGAPRACLDRLPALPREADQLVERRQQVPARECAPADEGPFGLWAAA